MKTQRMVWSCVEMSDTVVMVGWLKQSCNAAVGLSAYQWHQCTVSH